MSSAVSKDITQLLLDWSGGDRRALDSLIPLVYKQLRQLAASYLRRERAPYTLQSTALVHEAFLRLVDQRCTSWQTRAHFFGATAQIMRRILIDRARARRRGKRNGIQLELDESLAAPERRIDLIALDEALDELAALDNRQSRIVELRFFGGLSIEEAAEVLGISPMTVKREWAVARVWLFRRLAHAQSQPEE